MEGTHYRIACDLGRRVRLHLMTLYGGRVTLTQDGCLLFAYPRCSHHRYLPSDDERVCVRLRYETRISFSGVLTFDFEKPCTLVEDDGVYDCYVDLYPLLWTAACRYARGAFDSNPSPATTSYRAMNQSCMLCNGDANAGEVHCTQDGCIETVTAFCRASYLLWCLKDHLCPDIFLTMSKFAAEICIEIYDRV